MLRGCAVQFVFSPFRYERKIGRKKKRPKVNDVSASLFFKSIVPVTASYQWLSCSAAIPPKKSLFGASI